MLMQGKSRRDALCFDFMPLIRHNSITNRTSFPFSSLNLLGLDPANARSGNFAAISNHVPIIFQDIEIEVEKKFRFRLRAGFSEMLIGWDWGLLGMNDFFAHFASVRFNPDNFELETRS